MRPIYHMPEVAPRAAPTVCCGRERGSGRLRQTQVLCSVDVGRLRSCLGCKGKKYKRIKSKAVIAAADLIMFGGSL